MKILVTGCCGFIGSHLCEKLLKSYHEVYGIDIMNDYYDIKKKDKNLKILIKYKNFSFLRDDICNTKIISNWKPHKIIHCKQLVLIIIIIMIVMIIIMIKNKHKYFVTPNVNV